MTAHRSKAGFALPLVLTTVAVLTLVFAISLRSLANLRAETRLALSRAEFGRLALTAEARMQYLMATEPFAAAAIELGLPRPAGANPQTLQIPEPGPFGSIYLDARPYLWRETPGDAALPAYVAAVQDEAGLVNLYDADVNQLTRFFEQIVGLPFSDAELLANELIEYNLDPTLHPPMRKTSELYRLPSASSVLSDAAYRRLSEKAVSYPDSRAVNMNTAPVDVLAVLFDLPLEDAQEAVEMRASGLNLRTPAEIGANIQAQGRNFSRSGGRLRFMFTDPATGLSYRSSLVITPNSAERPLWVENPQVVRLSSPMETYADDLEEFPEIPDYTAER